MTLREALAAAERRLAVAGCDTPALDARVLLGHVTGRDHAGLLAHDLDALGSGEAVFEALVRRREAREPIAYLTGQKEFYSVSFEVGPPVLVPRPETELLVEAGLSFLGPRAGAAVADVGTGSGAVAILLARDSQAVVTALDLSIDALAVARRNAVRLLPGPARARLHFLRGNLTACLPGGSVDLVAANPPYLTDEEMRTASPELAFEPRIALDGGTADGLGVVRELIADARRILRPGGRLLCEIGVRQGDAVVEVASALGFVAAEVLRDLEGRPRLFSADAPESGGEPGVTGRG